MCIAYLALLSDPDWPLLIAANRDEFHARPALALAPWENHPDIIAGIDVQAGGTWLGITRSGRFGLLTNYREMSHHSVAAPTRGDLVSAYLSGSESAQEYSWQVSQHANAYNGFNLIVGDLATACYISNRHTVSEPQTLVAGRYVVSNHLLDTPWPKAERLRQAFGQLDTSSLTHSLRAVFDTLKDTTPAEDKYLPQTGLSLERERLLSSPFIISPDYGTRCSTVIMVHKTGRALVSEISYDTAGMETQRHDWPFTIPMVQEPAH